LGAGSEDGRVYLFTKDDNRPLWSYPTEGSVNSVSISADGSYLGAGSEDGRVYLFTKDDNHPLWSYQTEGPVNSVSISADGSYLGAGSEDGRVYLFTKDDNRPLWSYPTEGSVNSVSISADGSHVVAGSADNRVYLFITPELVAELEGMKENLRDQTDELDIRLEEGELEALEDAFLRGNLGAIMIIAIEADEPGFAKGYEHANIRTKLLDVVVGERVEIEVSSEVEDGKTIMINLDNRVLPVGQIERVLVDDENIGLADDYADALNPTDEDVPEYFVRKGGGGAQVLVSIPSFSTCTITIVTLTPASVVEPVVGITLYVIVGGAMVLLIVLITLVWRYRWVRRGRAHRKIPESRPT
jgi:WD40 repeat protein